MRLRLADASVRVRVVSERGRRRRYTYEKEIVLYAHFCKLDYFSTECVYSPFAYRGSAAPARPVPLRALSSTRCRARTHRFAREFLKDLEKARPRTIIGAHAAAADAALYCTRGRPASVLRRHHQNRRAFSL